MHKLELITAIQGIILFLLISILLFFVFIDNKKEKTIKKRNIYRNFSIKTTIIIVLTSIAITMFINSISFDVLTSGIVFSILIALVPYSIMNAQDRIKREAIFDDVILYCQNTAMLLKQTHNVYSSLVKVKDDLTTSIKEDVNDLLVCLDSDKQKVKESMEMMEHNYPYSCIKNLNVIIMHMQFEQANVNDALLINYQEDLDALEKDVRDNKIKRKSLRVTYIAITIISVVAYWFFVAQLKATFASGFDSKIYKTAHTLFVSLTLLSLFFVDRYFNSTTTKE